MSKTITLINSTSSFLSFPNFNIIAHGQKSVDLHEIQFDTAVLDVVADYINAGKVSCSLDSEVLSSEKVLTLKYRDVDNDGLIGKDETTANMDIYVDGSNGSDVSGDGSESIPYVTIDKAYNDIPYLIKHRVHIRYTAGTYTSFPNYVNKKLDRNGQLTFECTGDPVVLSGPHTIGTLTNRGVLAGLDITVSGASWTNDQWFGRFIKMTSGAGSGYTFPIYKNSSNAIKIPYNFAGIAATDSFNIIDPAANININQSITFDVDGSIYWSNSQFGIANTVFTSTEAKPFIWKGDAMSILTLCRFKVPTDDNIWIQSGGSVNSVPLLDSDGFDDTAYSIGYISSLQMCNSLIGAPAAPDTDIYIEPGKHSINSGINLNCFCTRTGVTVVTERSTLLLAAMDHLVIDHRAQCSASYCRFDVEPTYSTIDCIAIDDGGLFEGSNIFIDTAPRDILKLEDFSRAIIETIDELSSATRYALYLNGSCRLIFNAGSTSISGTTADIYFNRSAATHSLPSAGNNVNDSEDSWILAE